MSSTTEETSAAALETAADDQPPAETRPQDRGRVETSLQRLDRLAGILDDRFRIPGTDIRFGVDPLLGLLPGGGDWVAWVAGVYVIWESARLDVPPRKLVVMGGHVIVDLVAGYVPIAGDLFDVAYRSNRKNVEILFDHFDYRRREGGERQLPERLPDESTAAWRRYLMGAGLVLVLTLLAVAPLAFFWWLIGG